MDPKKQNQFENTQSPLQHQSSVLIDQQQQPTEYSTNILEEIKKITLDLGNKMILLQKDMSDFQSDIRKEIRLDLKEIKSSVEKATSEMVKIKAKISAIEEKQSEQEKNLGKINIKQDIQSEENLKWEYKLRDKSLRIRGVPEIENEDLYVSLIPKLAEYLNFDIQIFCLSVEKAFRLNSQIARQRKLPRDIVISFLNKRIRDSLIRKHSESPFKLKQADLQIFKDVPSKILRRRKDYHFLTLFLRQADVPYRWLIPEGLTFWYKKKKYEIKTTDEAKKVFDFISKDYKKEQIRQGKQNKEDGQNSKEYNLRNLKQRKIVIEEEFLGRKKRKEEVGERIKNLQSDNKNDNKPEEEYPLGKDTRDDSDLEENTPILNE